MFILRRKPGSTKVGGTLTCTWCGSPRLKLVDSFPPDRDVYRCKVCHKKLTYVRTPMSVDEAERLNRPSEHPYAHAQKLLRRFPNLGKFSSKKMPIIGKVTKIPIIKV